MKHIKAAYDMGINAFDTANVYSNGASEAILGKAIKEYNLPRDEIVVMTKVYAVVQRPGEKRLLKREDFEKARYVNQGGLSRKVSKSSGSRLQCVPLIVRLQHIFESVKHSLERLQLDYIDLLQC